MGEGTQPQDKREIKGVFQGVFLVALYCAMPRDYLSDTPLLRAMRFLVSQQDQLGAIPLRLF